MKWEQLGRVQSISLYVRKRWLEDRQTYWPTQNHNPRHLYILHYLYCNSLQICALCFLCMHLIFPYVYAVPLYCVTLLSCQSLHDEIHTSLLVFNSFYDYKELPVYFLIINWTLFWLFSCHYKVLDFVVSTVSWATRPLLQSWNARWTRCQMFVSVNVFWVSNLCMMFLAFHLVHAGKALAMAL